MANEIKPKTEPVQPMAYHIRLMGHMGSHWIERFGDLTITLEDNGDTLLTGPVVDQTALHGLLKKVRDLCMPLFSIILFQPGQSDASEDVKQQIQTLERRIAFERISILIQPPETESLP